MRGAWIVPCLRQFSRASEKLQYFTCMRQLQLARAAPCAAGPAAATGAHARELRIGPLRGSTRARSYSEHAHVLCGSLRWQRQPDLARDGTRRVGRRHRRDVDARRDRRRRRWLGQRARRGGFPRAHRPLGGARRGRRADVRHVHVHDGRRRGPNGQQRARALRLGVRRVCGRGRGLHDPRHGSDGRRGQLVVSVRYVRAHPAYRTYARGAHRTERD